MRKDKVFKLFSVAAVLLLFVLVFRFWLTPQLMFGGDFFFPPFLDQLEKLPAKPFAWDMQKGAGLGGRSFTTMWIDSYTQTLPNALMQLGIPAWVVQKLVFQIPLLALSIFSSLYLFRLVFPQYRRVALLVPVIFSLNTYFLMVVAGGQTGVALGYSIAPLVLAKFFKLINSIRSSLQNFQFSIFNFQLSLLSGLLLAFQVWVDLRIAYITFLVVILYALFVLLPLLAQKQEIKAGIWWRLRLVFFIGLIPMAIVGLLHAFWLLPIIIFRANPVSQLSPAYTSAGAVSYFSFADFSHALALLHANWPENIFGKTYFLQPEFMVLPILAFASLLFINRNKEEKKYILFFAVLGLVGAFLAKGANQPLGAVYFWLFDHVPGFIMLRDSTKFYLLVATSYAMLIPVTLERIASFKKIYYMLFAVFIVFWAWTIRPAVNGQVGGLLRPKVIDQEYVALKNLLLSEKQFIRTFVVPVRQRYVYFSTDYPSIDGTSLLQANSISVVLDWLKQDTAQEQLARWAVKYVVVPTDPEAEIFLNDRKYDPLLRQQVLNQVRSIKWLKEKTGFGPLGVFEAAGMREHFWTQNTSIKYKTINPTKYEVQLSKQTDNTTLIFSETYDSDWVLHLGNTRIASVKTTDGLNSFLIPAGVTQAAVEYEPQRYVDWGLVASGIGLLLVGGGLWASWALPTTKRRDD